MTLADVAVACAAHDVIEPSGGDLMSPKDIASLPHFMRWYKTVTHNPAFGSKSLLLSAHAKVDGTPSSVAVEQVAKTESRPPASAPPSTSRGLQLEGNGGVAATGGASEEPLPVVGEGGDLLSSAAVVQGARELAVAPSRFRRKRVRVRELLANGKALVGQRVMVKGWLRTSRAANKGQLLFLVVDDGSCSETIQVGFLYFCMFWAVRFSAVFCKLRVSKLFFSFGCVSGGFLACLAYSLCFESRIFVFVVYGSVLWGFQFAQFVRSHKGLRRIYFRELCSHDKTVLFLLHLENMESYPSRLFKAIVKPTHYAGEICVNYNHSKTKTSLKKPRCL